MRTLILKKLKDSNLEAKWHKKGTKNKWTSSKLSVLRSRGRLISRFGVLKRWKKSWLKCYTYFNISFSFILYCFILFDNRRHIMQTLCSLKIGLQEMVNDNYLLPSSCCGEAWNSSVTFRGVNFGQHSHLWNLNTKVKDVSLVLCGWLIKYADSGLNLWKGCDCTHAGWNPVAASRVYCFFFLSCSHPHLPSEGFSPVWTAHCGDVPVNEAWLGPVHAFTLGCTAKTQTCKHTRTTLCWCRRSTRTGPYPQTLHI